MGKQKTISLIRILVLVFMLAIMIVSVIPVHAQISRPTSTFTINQLEAYRNVQEELDTGFLILGTIDYTTSPANYSVSESYLVRLKDAVGVELGVTTFYSFSDSGLGYDYGAAWIYFDAATAPAWAGAYTVSIEGNPTLHWLDTTATHTMSGAVANDGGVLTDETAVSNSAAANDMTLLPAIPAVDDAYYFGADGMFNILTVNVGTNGSWTGTYAWEYYNGSAWVSVSGLVDGTTGFTAGTGNRSVTYTCPQDWQQVAVNGTSLYWLRFRVVTYTAVVTQPLGTQSWTNKMDNPPTVSSGVFSLWYDGTTVSATEEQLTIRLRTVATTLENDWGAAYDLIEDTAAGKKLTEDGETYFVNTIPNIRDICPDLFSASLSAPEFGDSVIIQDGLLYGEDADYDAYGANNIYGQTFTASDYYQIKGSWLKLYRVGNPGNMVLRLRATAVGLPAGVDLVTGTETGNTITTDTDGEWVEFAFTTEYTLISGTVYSLVLDALAGGVANYASWLVDTGNTYAGGQACFFNGAIWVAAGGGGSDFLFSNTAFEGYSMSYRDRLSMRLVGTRFDMTNLGTNFGMSRMWMTFIIYFLITVLFAVVFSQGVGSYKYVSLVIGVMFGIAPWFGAVYLDVGILMFVGGIGLAAYIGGYEKT